MTLHVGPSEWTRTPAGEAAIETELSFGVPFVFMQPQTTESGETHIEPHAMFFEDRSLYVGFRTVLELPDDPKGAAELLKATK